MEVENFQSLAILIILHVTGCHFEMRKICHIAHIFSWKKSCYTCKHFFAVSLEFPNWYWDAFSPLFVVSPYLQLDIWNKVSKNASSKICGNQPLKKLLRQTISFQSFWRLSSTNFIYSILEYFVPFIQREKNVLLLKIDHMSHPILAILRKKEIILMKHCKEKKSKRVQKKNVVIIWLICHQQSLGYYHYYHSVAACYTR